MKILKKITSNDDYTTRLLLDYLCFNSNFRLVAIDLSMQKELKIL